MSVLADRDLAHTAVLTIKFLAVDAVERAKSGHPGMPMGAADLAFTVWSRFLRYDPAHPDWPDRDRFVLSAGHGCMLLYSLLHLAGYDLPLEQLKRFRQWGSMTPGHPEWRHTPGVEATTGPLGQGVGNAVGMALGAKLAAARFNADGFTPVTHRVFCLASDGDLMEGVSGEASSLAGHLGLGNLVVYHDDNRISIDGSTAITFTEDVGRRYEAYGWHVQRIDAHDHEAVARATEAALAATDRPSLIVARSHIAAGAATKQDTAESHGAPLGPEEVKRTREKLGWPDEPFHVPEEVYALFRRRAEEGARMRQQWDRAVAEWSARNPQRAAEWDALWERKVPEDLVDRLLAAAPAKADATRGHAGALLQEAARHVPALVGGSADLAGSTKTVVKGSPPVKAGDFGGRNIAFGVREHGMGAICNGLLYHGAFRPFASTFLQFADYMRPSIRLSALAGMPALWMFTHDSIFLGEDGPTHQPVEHAWALRLIPNLDVWRPADARETAVALGVALKKTSGPSAILLTRQTVPAVSPGPGSHGDPRRGAWRVVGEGRPDAVVAATGSEVGPVLAARETLAREGKNLHVVSIPCLEVFRREDPTYKASLFPQGVKVAVVEAGTTHPWHELAGTGGLVLGIDTFGASAPAEVLAEKYGMDARGITDRLRTWLG